MCSLSHVRWVPTVHQAAKIQSLVLQGASSESKKEREEEEEKEEARQGLADRHGGDQSGGQGTGSTV